MNPEARRILVLDPEEESGAEALRELGRDGFQVTAVLTLKRALALMARQEYDLVVVALGVAGLTTRKLLGRIRESAPRVPLLALVQSGRSEQAVRALKGGAEDYLTKPVDPYDLKSRVRKILERRDLADRLTHLQTALTQRYALTSIVQHSPAMKGVVQRISQVAPASSTVLILGESGVGKELVAKAIHFNSPRRHRPFLAINCSAIPANLIESELFGHERGAFTGAVERVRGKFEMAEGGTIFLDEVGEMDPQTQVKLLRVMEEREFMRLGGSRNIRIDVRVLAATNASLQQRIRQGKFREDLYFRLQVITLQVPPLRERAADLPELIRFFLDSLSRTNGVPIPEIAPEVLFLLRGYSWPGNVRELKNLLESLVVTLPGQRIEAADLPPAIRGEQALEAIFPNVEAGMTLREMERELIQKTLANTDGNRTRAARILEIGVRTLQRKIREYGLR